MCVWVSVIMSGHERDETMSCIVVHEACILSLSVQTYSLLMRMRTLISFHRQEHGIMVPVPHDRQKLKGNGALRLVEFPSRHLAHHCSQYRVFGAMSITRAFVILPHN